MPNNYNVWVILLKYVPITITKSLLITNINMIYYYKAGSLLLFIWFTYYCLRLPRFPRHLDQSEFRIIFTPEVRPGTISVSMNQNNFD